MLPKVQNSKSEVPILKLGDIAEFKNGVNYNSNSFGKGIKVVGVKDFQNYFSPRYEGLEEINPDGIVRDNNILEDGDLIFVRSNGNKALIGRSLFIKNLPDAPITHSAFTIRARFDKRKCIPIYYAYALRTDLIRRTLSSQGGGTNISNLNQDILSNLSVPAPPLEIQKNIAAILSAYDDHIENNQRRIKILEEMAQNLYREWFVHFRFPGYEAVPLIDSPLGKIPKGWKTKKVGECIKFLYGKALKKEDRTPGPYPVYGSSGIVDYHCAAFVQKPGIIVGRKGNVGSIFRTSKPFYPIDTVYFIQSELPDNYLFHALSRMNFLNNDAAVPGLNRNQAYSLDVLVPCPKILEEFERLADPIYQLSINLVAQNENLARTRDFLLPKLVSGEVDLSVAVRSLDCAARARKGQ
jgi:type I restriction enzyme, S subunit